MARTLEVAFIQAAMETLGDLLREEGYFHGNHYFQVMFFERNSMEYKLELSSLACPIFIWRLIYPFDTKQLIIHRYAFSSTTTVENYDQQWRSDGLR